MLLRDTLLEDTQHLRKDCKQTNKKQGILKILESLFKIFSFLLYCPLQWPRHEDELLLLELDDDVLLLLELDDDELLLLELEELLLDPEQQNLDILV